MTDDEKFLFDLRGYLVLENVLPEEEVDAANAAIDEHKDLIVHGEPRLARDSEALKGTMSRGGFTQHPLSFDRPWCEPFRSMLTHPKVVDIFNEILGPGFRYDHAQMLVRMIQGTEGHFLHGATTRDPSQYHRFAHGKLHCGLCVASWQLTETRPGDGGFVVVPGSHKSCYPLPHSVRTCNERAPIRHVPMRRGSVVFFLGGTVCHGAYRWESESPRRTALFTYGHDGRRPFAWPAIIL